MNVVLLTPNSYREPPIKLPHDSSLVTYRGHSVHKTLIRCHFSPPTSTGSRYVYTGSSDGKAKIYNLDATIAGEVDVNAATLNTRPVDERSNNSWYRDWDEGSNSRTSWKTCVRDVSWHPSAPVLAGLSSDYSSCRFIFRKRCLTRNLATCWNGYGFTTGTVSLHTWNGGKSRLSNRDGKVTARRYNAQMRPRFQEASGDDSDDMIDEI